MLQLTLNVPGPRYPGLTRSISWLLMSWLLASPGHQHPCYWLYKIGSSFARGLWNNLMVPQLIYYVNIWSRKCRNKLECTFEWNRMTILYYQNKQFNISWKISIYNSSTKVSNVYPNKNIICPPGRPDYHLAIRCLLRAGAISFFLDCRDINWKRQDCVSGLWQYNVIQKGLFVRKTHLRDKDYWNTVDNFSE